MPISWTTNVDEAMSDARSNRKLLLFDFNAAPM